MSNGAISICDKMETKLSYFRSGYMYTCHDIEMEINVFGINVNRKLINNCFAYLKDYGLRRMTHSKLLQFLKLHGNSVK